MKKLILLFFILFNTFFIQSVVKKIDEDNTSLVLILKNEQGENYLTSLPLSKLKQCTFPTGPLRNNEITNTDFRKINQNIVEKIQESIKNEEYLQLSLFCIDSESEGVRCKTCAFSVPDRGDLCYVFKFETPLKDTTAAVLTNDQLDDLNIDIETTNCDNPVNTSKPVSKLEKYLTVCIMPFIIGSMNVAEQFKSLYGRIINYITKIRSEYVRPKT